MTTSSELIEKFKLEPHPEGGFYRECYKSADRVLPSNARYAGEDRTAGTSILFLLQKGDFSAWHSVSSDETWYFNHGDDLMLRVINPETNEMSNIVLGLGGDFQFTVPAGHVFSAESLGGYTLVSCNVMPGFEFKDFKLFSQTEMSHLCTHPEWPTIKRLIRDQAVDSAAVREGLVPVEASAGHMKAASLSPSKKENIQSHTSSLFFPHTQSDKAPTAAPNEEVTQLVTVMLKSQPNLYRAVMEKLIKEEPDYRGLTQQLIEQFSPESSPRSPRNTKALAV